MLGEILLTAVNAVFPILCLIFLGYRLKQSGFLTGEFVKLGNKLVFNICLPAMLFVNVYNIPSFADIKWDVVIYTTLVICLLFLLGGVVALVTTKDPRRRGVIMQCVYRSNYAIIGLPLAQTLGGSEASAVAAVVSAFAVPLYNVFAVISLTVFMKGEGSQKVDVKRILLNIVKNPLIIGALAGLVCLLLRQLQTACFGEVVFALNRQTEFLYETLVDLKAITTPLALIVLGGQFTFTAVKGMFREIAVGTVFRVVIAPAIGIGLAVLLTAYTEFLSCTSVDYPALIALFGTPVAVSSAVMAGAMDNDQQLATQLVVWTSICSVLTVFMQVCILMATGIMAV